MPSRSTRSSNRRTPRKQSRRMSSVHHSPTTSSAWATEQFMSANDALRASTIVRELHHRTQRRTVGCVTELTQAEAISDFDRTTTVGPTDRPGEFEVELDPGWSSLVGVHGGYLCALAVRGAEALAPDRTVRTITTSFLRSGEVGPATLVVQELRRGRSMSTMVTELRQGDRLLITSRLTLLTARDGVEWSTPVRLDLPARDQCVRMDPGRVSH